MREALDALELVVVIDVAMTETARHAHYVLPAASQFEKWEATFFTLEFPENVFQLRAPLLRRRCRARSPSRRSTAAWCARSARSATTTWRRCAPRPRRGARAFAAAFLADAWPSGPSSPGSRRSSSTRRSARRSATGAEAAALLWGAAHTCAMTYPESVRRAGFARRRPRRSARRSSRRSSRAARASPSPSTSTRRPGGASRRPTAAINLAIPELLDELAALRDERAARATREFPFVLAAGERRSSTANTIFRDPAWRKKDADGALRMSPADADAPRRRERRPGARHHASAAAPSRPSR